MTLNWDTFKCSLGSYWETSYVVYVDEEGIEIPIRSDAEFQKALRTAKENKNRLKLIFYDKNIPNSQKMLMTFPESVRVFTSSGNAAEASKNTKIHSSTEFNDKEKSCCCSGDVPPEWFSHYMKKFKKDLLHELRLSVFEAFDNSTKKGQKPTYSELDAVDLCLCNNEILSSPISKHSKKKKKASVKDKVELAEQRDLKLSKKLEKLHLTRSEKLEKLDSKTKLLMEEKKKLLERKRHSKSKLEKNSTVASENKNSVKKSASFLNDDVCLYLVPGGEFTLTLYIKNDGNLRWCSPRLECFDVTSLYPNESYVNLPKLLPNESCFVTLRGRANHVLGLNHFKCKVMEEQEKISPEFICRARVDRFEPRDKYCNVSVDLEERNIAPVQSGNAVDKLIDFEKDELIFSSKKKIEENIMEIEKRLQYIDLLTSGEPKKTPGKTKKVFTKNPETQAEGCDLLEGKEKNWTKRLEEEEVLFGVDCLRLASDGNEAKAIPKTDENQQPFEKDPELESSSDSEISMIFMSEEEENFIVVPIPSKSPSPAESVHEDKKGVNVEPENKPSTSQEQPEPNVIKEQPLKPAITIKIQRKVDKETSTPDNLSPSQFNSPWSRRSPFGEEIPKSKAKKMKSKSTEYRFTTANLTQPTFTAAPDKYFTERPSKFTFTGQKREKPPQNVFKFTFKSQKEGKNQKDDLRRKTVPKTDASGRVIYAVTNLGHCLPVDDLFQNGEHSRNLREDNSQGNDQEKQNQNEKQNDRFNEIPSVNILPNVLMNGASFAFNTAKSVINNLQSAFVTEGKTELGKPACEDKKKVSMENMFKLYEMGFYDLQINRKLLLMHDNDISKVIEELVRLEENSSKRSE